MQLTQLLFLALAAILLGARLPSYLDRIGVSRKDKIAFVAIAFLLLGLAWFAVQGYSLFF